MDVKDKVKELLIEELGFEDKYHFGSIDEVIDRLLKLDKDPKSRILYQLKYEEGIRVDIMNSLIENIKQDLIESRHNYLWGDENPKDDYEKGVWNTIRLLEFRIHCIMD